MKLSEFLLARIAEDENEARDMPWNHVIDPERQIRFRARLLAECEAKRRIVEVYNIRHLLEILVQPYADHPDYRQEWRA